MTSEANATALALKAWTESATALVKTLTGEIERLKAENATLRRQQDAILSALVFDMTPYRSESHEYPKPWRAANLTALDEVPTEEFATRDGAEAYVIHTAIKLFEAKPAESPR